MEFILVSLFVLAWSVTALPSLKRKKAEEGRFFTDHRILISKREGYGNNLNQQNILGFSFNVFLGLLMFVYGLTQI